MRTRPTVLSIAIASLFAATSSLAQERKEEAQRMETISIIGEGDKLGTGMIIQEESPKARSTTTRSALDKQRSTQNPYQGLQLLPGVNTSSHDATGMFGGNMRVRGFNADQMGFTVDGSPVNDSGSFAVFPMEYTDAENMCELFVTQGTPDADAPHVGASGGNIGIVTCGPAQSRGAKIQQTLGQLHLSKTFVRADTGKLPFANGWSSFISYSHSEVDKWRGKGGADRDHIDFATQLMLPVGRLALTALWNHAINHNYRFGTKAQFDADYKFDNAETFVGNPTPVNGTRQTPPTQDTYYQLSLNPFRNAIVTAKANLNFAAFKLDIEPYYWHGYGTGGINQTTINEGGTFRGGVQDINGDGDRLDTVLVYRSSLTNTNRPGVNARVSTAFGSHRVAAGWWYERARHKQTGPGVRVNSDGTSTDVWLADDNLILRGDGTPFNLRDQLTISRGGNLFVSDSMGFMNEKLRIDLSVKRSFIDRDYNNFANEGTGQGVDYRARKKFEETLPAVGARYQFDAANQVFLNVAKNFRAPSNTAWQGAIISGVNRTEAISANLRSETSVSSDLGYRHYGKAVTFSGSLFNADYKDRLARRFVPEEGATIDTNVGDGRIRGAEVELGTTPVRGFSGYVSASYTRSRMESDLRITSTNTQPTAGKDFADTPRWLSSLSLQYAQPQFYVTVQTKYTGKRFSTLTNDESVPGYATVDLNAGYRFGDFGFVRNVIARANLSNIFDRKYLTLTALSGSSFTINATGTGSQAPFYVAGAPRFASMSVSAEF